MNVLIVDNNAEMVEYLRKEVESVDVIESVTTVTSSIKGITAVESKRPSLLVCVLDQHDNHGMELITRASDLNVPSMVISSLCDEKTVIDAVESGARGYLLTGDVERIRFAVRDILDGGSPVTPSIARYLFNCVKSKEAPNSAYNLTHDLSKRETEVLRLSARGYKVAEVANILDISFHTVGNHNRSVYRKLKVNSRSQAVYVAIQSGLVNKVDW